MDSRTIGNRLAAADFDGAAALLVSYHRHLDNQLAHASDEAERSALLTHAIGLHDLWLTMAKVLRSNAAREVRSLCVQCSYLNAQQAQPMTSSLG